MSKTDPTPEVSARYPFPNEVRCPTCKEYFEVEPDIGDEIRAAYARGKEDGQQRLEQQVMQAVYNHLGITEIGAALVGKITLRTRREIAEGICKQLRTIRALDLEE